MVWFIDDLASSVEFGVWYSIFGGQSPEIIIKYIE